MCWHVLDEVALQNLAALNWPGWKVLARSPQKTGICQTCGSKGFDNSAALWQIKNIRWRGSTPDPQARPPRNRHGGFAHWLNWESNMNAPFAYREASGMNFWSCPGSGWSTPLEVRRQSSYTQFNTLPNIWPCTVHERRNPYSLRGIPGPGKRLTPTMFLTKLHCKIWLP